jgi:CRISPR-associated protein Cas1
MALLLLDRAQIEVKSEGDTLVLYEAGTRSGTVPIKLIDRCVIHGAQTRLDSGVLSKLAEAGITTVLMSPRSARRVAIVLGPKHNDAAVRLAQAQRVMDAPACRQWAASLVRAKLCRQRRTLHHLQSERPDARKPLFDALQTLAAIGQNLNAEAWPALERLRGFEGAAAHAYFGGLTSVFAPALNFTGRNRRPPRDPVNVCLSLSYTMLNAQAVQSCNTAGLDPLLGFYHRPSFGRESLASDLIEPLRPAVDLWVWELLRSHTLREEHFTLDKGACLLGKEGRHIYYSEWEKGSRLMRRWLRLQCRSLAHGLQQQGQAWLLQDSQAGDASWD